MPSKTIHTPAKSASRWWRLDPLVAAHLRSSGRPDGQLTAEDEAVARVKRWSAEADSVAWADTDWCDTQVDTAFD